ncbi:DUF1549 domain-containing protein [Planctellipticum variicoloris]|uniref:DUF1549 domain-containing protein n=1 Tax=Planctellipticum variicoloris TaxID=3064265 RepID=UPI003013DDD6|nr:DUF1549 and DUF1553 domain-containing protein [Planctomycetaceae bacterium SH412]
MLLKASSLLMTVTLLGGAAAAQEPAMRLSTRDLAEWIDRRFEGEWERSKIEPSAVVDDATFLKRTYLDLGGTLPRVSEAREFLDYAGEQKRDALVDQLLNETRRPEKHAARTAAHWATLWRRMMAPGNTPEARMAIGLEPWLREQFLANVPYDELARKLVTASSTDGTPVVATNPQMGMSGGPAVFYLATGGKPETSASAVSRVFLGVRIGCAECHNHPFASWKQQDFWGMAAFFAGVKNGTVADVAVAKIRPLNGLEDYTAAYLGGGPAEVPAGKTPRQALADWMVSRENAHFAATAVNRVWQQLVGRGLTDSVDDLDLASAEEREILDELAELFVDAGFDLRWLMTGICKSRVYQRGCVALEEGEIPPPGFRPVKALQPEQIFDSLEQALALPISRADGGARFNGLRDQLISRMNEAAANAPEEYRAGIPQALLMMNGRLTAEATDLEQSRTLRGVLDAPFLNAEAKLETLYLATLSRRPSPQEQEFLLAHVRKETDERRQQEAFAEIFWGLLNSPEFVLER